MTLDSSSRRHRILVVDDNESIHELMRRILVEPAVPVDARLQELSAELFGEANPVPEEPASRRPAIELDGAHQGDEAVRMVRDAAKRGIPYFLAFVDIRMPPGMDGVQTVKAIWEEYPDLYVVICSAYSDYTWQSLSEEIGYSPNLLILRKPFDAVEVRQIVASVGKMYHVIEQV